MIPCHTLANIAVERKDHHIIQGTLLFDILFRTKNTAISKIRNIKKWSVFMAEGVDIAIDTFLVGSAIRIDVGKTAASSENSG